MSDTPSEKTSCAPRESSGTSTASVACGPRTTPAATRTIIRGVRRKSDTTWATSPAARTIAKVWMTSFAPTARILPEGLDGERLQGGLDLGADGACLVDERFGGGRAVAVAVPGDRDQARRWWRDEREDGDRSSLGSIVRKGTQAMPTPAATRPCTVPLSSERKTTCGPPAPTPRCASTSEALRQARNPIREMPAMSPGVGGVPRVASSEPAGTSRT